MDGSGGGKSEMPMNSFSRTWMYLNDPTYMPWLVAYVSIFLCVVMAGGLWLGLQDFKEKLAAISPVAFQECVDQIERMQPDVGTKYKTIECRPDGSLSVTAVYAQ